MSLPERASGESDVGSSETPSCDFSLPERASGESDVEEPLDVGDKVEFTKTDVTAAGEGTIVRFNGNIVIIKRLNSHGAGRGKKGELVRRAVHNCQKITF